MPQLVSPKALNIRNKCEKLNSRFKFIEEEQWAGEKGGEILGEIRVWYGGSCHSFEPLQRCFKAVHGFFIRICVFQKILIVPVKEP